jgi:hypothetical protein
MALLAGVDMRNVGVHDLIVRTEQATEGIFTIGVSRRSAELRRRQQGAGDARGAQPPACSSVTTTS